MRYRIIDNRTGQEIDQAANLQQLKAKIIDKCTIHDTHENMWCLPEILLPEIITEQSANEYTR